MKKRTIILAMLAAMLMVTSDFTVNILHAEEMQTEEIRTAAETEETSQLPIKALSPKVVAENPYMAKSDVNIHHDCYNTDSTDEVLPVDIYSEINV